MTGSENGLPALEKLLREEQDRLAKRKNELQKQLDEVSVRLSHVNGLLGYDLVSGNDSNSDPAPGRQTATDIAVAILSEQEKEPMHYKELAKEVLARGGNLPGKNPANNLVAKLVNDGRFVRPRNRGEYALRSDYPGFESVGTRRQRENGDNIQDETLDLE